jgi:DNA-binding PadR family transcriptional regulator
MTDGNLTTHAKRLHLAGLLQIDKAFRDGKPVTTFTLTEQGRDALETHVERLVQALRPSDQPAEPATPIHSFPDTSDENWID